MSLSCRLCGHVLRDVFCDLGTSPLSNAYLTAEQLLQGETHFPLRTYVCRNCLLVQLPVFEAPDAIFSDYAYFSSYSDSWLAHAREYSEEMITELGLDGDCFVVEVASNDGYLLKNFVAHDIPVLGVEPAENVASVARAAGVQTLVRFFGRSLADELAATRQADLIAANNVFAHVPDLDDFTAGLARLLAPTGVLTIEFPHLLRLIEQRQFDTIYHEHFSYFSLLTARRALERHKLVVYDVRELPTHGGSLRLYVCHEGARQVKASVAALGQQEARARLDRIEPYLEFDAEVQLVKRELLKFLIGAREQGKVVVGYGAPAKGNTLLNYCGVRTDMIAFTVDRSPHKQGRYLPGSRIAIHDPEEIRLSRPDFVLILPWNLKEEIAEQLSFVREWGGRLAVPIPSLEILE